MKIGSEAHKILFCETFLAAHRPYEPSALPWPELSETHLERLRAIPFWRTALGVEQNAGRMVSGFSGSIADPLVRRAVALQGQEESRHARLLETFISRYNIPVEAPPLPATAPTKSAFTVFGYEECLDSYFGFGIFAIARKAGYMPDELLALFTPVLEEEARHIVFFVNWIAYERARAGLSALGPLLSAAGYLRAVLRLVATASGLGREGTGFLAPGAQRVGSPEMSPRYFLESCERENERQMDAFDTRLLRPRVVPAIASTLLRFMPRPRRTASAQPAP